MHRRGPSNSAPDPSEIIKPLTQTMDFQEKQRASFLSGCLRQDSLPQLIRELLSDIYVFYCPRYKKFANAMCFSMAYVYKKYIFA